MKVINNLKYLFDVKNIISIHNFILLFIIFLIFCSIFNNTMIEGITTANTNSTNECSELKIKKEENDEKKINELKIQIQKLKELSKKLNITTTAHTKSIKDLDTKYTNAKKLLQKSQKQGDVCREKATNTPPEAIVRTRIFVQSVK